MNHTLAEGESHEPEARLRFVRGEPATLALLAREGLDRADTLGDRALGEVVTDHRSSWVRRTTIDGNEVYVKTYDYPTARDRWRGVGRTTFLVRSRAAREADALQWLRRGGFGGPAALAVGERRRFGVLARSILVTAAWPGEPVDRLLRSLPSERERQTLLAAVRALVARLHAAGFRDRNLDLRNLLARQDGGGGFEVVKIDSPRYRTTGPGARVDRLVRMDLARLEHSIEAARR